MNYPMRLFQRRDGLWIAEDTSSAIMLEHLSGGSVAVNDSEIPKLRHLALLHGWRLLLPGETFE